MPELSTKANAQRYEWKDHPFRLAVLRGLAVMLPPLLTIVILLWVWNTVQDYVLVPVETGVRHAITWVIADTHDFRPGEAHDEPALSQQAGKPVVRLGEEYYVQVANDQWLPLAIYRRVAANPGPQLPATAEAIYHRFVDITYLRRYLVVPLFLSVFILFLYLLGKFLAAGIGRLAWSQVELLIHRLPVIRNVYGSVKQVTDFVFSEQEIAYTRVVAVEYPRTGIWSLGFVTSEGIPDIRAAANEPVLSVLIPTSPMPATGFTVTVRKSEAVDLNMTLDQAFQYIMSCGVIVPPASMERRQPEAPLAPDPRQPAATLLQ